MPVKMVAIRPHYDRAKGVEYKTGQTFDVASEADADRLENKLKKARRHTEPAAPAAKPAIKTKVLTAESEPTPAVPEPQAEPVSFASFTSEATEPPEGTRRSRYRRNDLRSED